MIAIKTLPDTTLLPGRGVPGILLTARNEKNIMEATAMNSESLDECKRQVLSDVTRTLFEVSDSIPPSQKIEMDTMVIGDLGLESIQIANLLFRLHVLYSGAVSFADFISAVAGSDWQLDAPVGTFVEFVAASLWSNQGSNQAGPGPVPEDSTDQVAHS